MLFVLNDARSYLLDALLNSHNLNETNEKRWRLFNIYSHLNF